MAEYDEEDLSYLRFLEWQRAMDDSIDISQRLMANNEELSDAIITTVRETDVTIDRSLVDESIAVAPESHALDALYPTRPSGAEFGSIVVSGTEFTAVLPAVSCVSISLPSPPPFNVPPPGIDIPPPPVVSWPIFNYPDPYPREIAIPDDPDINIPVAPIIPIPVIPGPPDWDVPDFSAEPPIDDLTPPVPVFNWSEDPYTSDLQKALIDKLLNDIASGGSGLDEVTEQAIYDRAKSRMALEEERKYDEVLNYFSSRGHPIPPGALNGQLQEIRNAILQTRTDLNNDILVQQSNLAQKNTHFVIEQSRLNEQDRMQMADRIQTRTFESSKFALEAALLVYKAKVDAFNAKMEGYKIEAQVYNTRVQAELIKAEFYKAQIEGVKVSAEVSKLLVDIYNAKIAAVGAQVELYKGLMEGARIESQIEANKIQAYVAYVQGFTGRVNSVVARYEGYKAQIEGERAKAETYKAQVDAYGSQVGAYKATVDALVAAGGLEIECQNTKIKAYAAHVEKLKADYDYIVRTVTNEIGKMQVDVDWGKVEASIYGHDITGKVGELQAAAQIYSAQLNLQAQVIASRMREATLMAEIQSANIRAQAAAQAQVQAAQIATRSWSNHIGQTTNVNTNNNKNETKYEKHGGTKDTLWHHQHMYYHDR